MKRILIYGTGCAKCRELAANAEGAAKAAGVEFEILKITDIEEIAKAGVMFTPALSIDGVIRTNGKVPSAEEIEKMLK